MDEAKMREQIDNHAKAAERGDIETITNDFIEELHPQVPVGGHPV